MTNIVGTLVKLNFFLGGGGEGDKNDGQEKKKSRDEINLKKN